MHLSTYLSENSGTELVNGHDAELWQISMLANLSIYIF